MRLVRVRFAFAVLCSAALCHLTIEEVTAQRRQVDRLNPPPRTAQGRQLRRRTQDQIIPAAPSGTAATTATPSAQPAAQTPVLEKADPQAREDFLKLIGANWIWSPAHPKDEVPASDCYFRKAFTAKQVELAQIHVACDNKYELYVNGRLAGQGADWRKMDVHDIAKFLIPGKNVVAIKATNTDAGAAGLVARIIVKEKGTTLVSYSSDATWRTSVKEFGNWTQPNVRDGDWVAAKVYGPLGGVLPWGDEIVIADEGSRFLVDPEFAIDRLVTDEQAGSLIAMAFNANGEILASQENGPLLLIRDTNNDGTWESIQPFCGDVKNVQGMLSLGNRVFVVGGGPQGGALYQINDDNNDGRSDKITPIVGFRGQIGEHGPHTVRLGPDGLLYLLSGNFSQPDASSARAAPTHMCTRVT